MMNSDTVGFAGPNANLGRVALCKLELLLLPQLFAEQVKGISLQEYLQEVEKSIPVHSTMKMRRSSAFNYED